MDFQEAVQSGFRRWNRTDGRSSRSEYWWWVLFSFLLALVASLVFGVFASFGRTAAAVVALAFVVAFVLLIVPSFTLSVRRLHDTDRSGWWLLVGLVPYLGGLILLVIYCLDGSPGPNRFGDRPGGSLSTYRPDIAPFAPTARVPQEGMASWPTADPAGPVTPLAGGLHLAVIHRVDDWAQVRASNGWVGWVDARRLAPLAPPPPPPPDLSSIT
jgi:uncharacterized membrane protein YhaH (DUF805 family)